MGEDKALLPIDGVPMIQRIKDAVSPIASAFILSVAVGDDVHWPGMTTVPDKQEDMGPLMGIYSALSASSTNLNVITACDIPFIHPELVRTLLSRAEGREIVLPSFGGGRPEPLLGIYRKSVALMAECLLHAGARKVAALFDVCTVEIVPFKNADWYFNLNTREEYEHWIRSADDSKKGGD